MKVLVDKCKKEVELTEKKKHSIFPVPRSTWLHSLTIKGEATRNNNVFMTEKLDIYVLGFQGHMWTLYTVSHVIQQHFQFSPQLA